MKQGRRRAVAYGLAAVALPGLVAAGGCGKSDKQKVVDQVNDICTDFNKEVKPLFKDVNNLDQLAAQGKKAIPKIDKTGKRLASVKAPEDVRKDLGRDYSAFVQNFGKEAAAFGAIIGSAQAGDRKSVSQLTDQLDKLDKDSNRLARKLGFDECAKG